MKDSDIRKEFNGKVKLYDENIAIEDMDDISLVNFLEDRFNLMSTATIRVNKELDWDSYDKQFTAMSVRDQYGNLKVNVPMEQNLIDLYEGRNANKLIFDIQPDGKQADVDELQPAQYALEYYLKWNGVWNGFYDMAPKIRRWKARYGTAFAFIGLENNRQVQYRIKDESEIESIADFENKENYEPYMIDSWEFFPHNIDIRSVYVDEKVLNQPDIQKAEDVFIEKQISLNKIKFVRDKNGYKNIDKLQESTIKDNTKNNKDYFATWQITIRFYYNQLSKDYIIYAPDNQLIIHRSKMLYNHGKLPIESVQHYADDNCLYGIGIPQKIRYLKWFKSEIMQSLLDNAAMSSWLNFVVGSGWEIDNWTLGGDWVNVWRTSIGAEEIKQIQPQINNGLINVLQIIDDLVVQDTGENVKAIIDMQTDKVGIVEMMEENKAVRHKHVDSLWNLFLNKSLSMMLSNIAQFAPSLLSKTTEVKVWNKNVTKIEYPYIRIDNAEVKVKWKKIIVDKEDNYGKLWYFELKPGTISPGLWVKVVTPSTTTWLPLIKKDAITKWIDNKMRLAQIASLDQTWQMMEQLKNEINIQEINDRMNDVYGFEDKLKTKTGKDKQKEKNIQKVEEIRDMMEAFQPGQWGWVLDWIQQSDVQKVPEYGMTNFEEGEWVDMSEVWIWNTEIEI